MPIKRAKDDDAASVISERFQPLKNVASLMGEGEKFCRDQLYSKAIQCYTEALELEEGNKIALVERAACYLRLGNNALALADAEESLKENKEFTKGLYEKAEALYAMGEFELALVFYHRGKKIRGDVKEFQLGINKAQEAIDNCVGDPHSVKLEVKGDLSYFNKVDEKLKKKQIKFVGAFQKSKQPTLIKREKRTLKPGTQKTVKQLLGELYADKVYLEKLLNDDNITRVNTTSGDAIWGLANNGLDFLDSRTEFWRQQKPIYARKNSYAANSDASANNPLNYVLKRLETIDNLQTNGKNKQSLDMSNKLLQYVQSFKKPLKGQGEIIANIHSNIGNANLELGSYDLALKSHEKDLEMSKSLDNSEGISRAYENIGRVYARNGKYSEAIEVWEKKLPLAETDMEKAWLYHEIGRCQLELGDYECSKDYGKKSLECAEAIDDEVWQLNATVLIAQSDVKIGTSTSLNSAVDNFERALKMTEKQNDNTAGNAIVKALAECRQKLEKVSSFPEGEDAEIRSKTSAKSNRDAPVKSTEKEEQREPTPVVHKEPTPPPKSPTPEPPKSVTPAPKTPTPTPKSPWPEPEPKSVTPGPKTPTPSPPKSAKSSKAASPAPKTPEAAEELKYRVEVKTSDNTGSGTVANVKITLLGSTDSIYDQALKKGGGKDSFESGDLDVFWIDSAVNIGKVNKIIVSHDGTGFGAGFLMDYVQVNFKDVTYKFDIGEWLQDIVDGKISKEFQLTEERDDSSSNYTK